MSRLKFTKEDFVVILGPGQGGPKADIYFDFRNQEFRALVLANYINQLLEKKMSEAIYTEEDLQALQSANKQLQDKVRILHEALDIATNELKEAADEYVNGAKKALAEISDLLKREKEIK